MKSYLCEQEQAAAAAARTGAWTDPLREHVRGCAVCSEVVALTGLLLQESRLAEHEQASLPDASLVWRKAQANARERALARAALPIRIAMVSACAGALIAVSWLGFNSAQSASWQAGPWLQVSLERWAAAFNEGVVMLAFAATLLCMVLGSWFILRED